MNWTVTQARVWLLMIPLLVILLGCSTTRLTGSGTLKTNDLGVPYVCSEQWMKDTSYADDGKLGQVVGEDTPETIRDIRRGNASKRKFCRR